MRRRSPILETLAEIYAESSLGWTGLASRAFSIPFEKLIRMARCESGDNYTNALIDLGHADGDAVILVRHPRSKDIQRVVVPLKSEDALFALIGRLGPTAERLAWANLFLEAAEWPVPPEYAACWRWFCQGRASAVNRGGGWQPFRRNQRHRARAILEVTARLLAWRRPALLRTASAQVTGDSKFLGRCRGAIEQLLAQSTDNRVQSFTDLQISDNPRFVRFHGPVRVLLQMQWVDFTTQSEGSLSEMDLVSATRLECTAPRCVTVENATKFLELSRLGSGDLFVFTSYPNRATVEFLRRLPPPVTRYHFGDTDPWGFDVLRALRAAVAPLCIEPLHMHYRAKPDSPLLTGRDRRKLRQLLSHPLLSDVRRELEQLETVGRKGDFEQETIPATGPFPYTGTV